MKFKIYILFLLIMQTVSAQKVLEKADMAYKKKEFAAATGLYKESLQVVKSRLDRFEIYMRLGDCYKFLNDNRNALKFYEQCYRARYKDPELYLKMGEVLLKMGEYDDALEFLNVYIEQVPNDMRAKNYGESCLFAKQNPHTNPTVIFKNEEELNSAFAEYGMSNIDDLLIFSSSRVEVGAELIYKVTGQGYTNFYSAGFDPINHAWDPPQTFEGNINTPYNEGTCTFDFKNNILYYMVCNGISGDKNNCGIYYSIYNKAVNTWSGPLQLNIAENQYSYGHPAISADGNRLFFVSDMPGGNGQKDVWFINKVNGNWQGPVNAGNKINTAGDEQFPYLSGDSVFYFSSDGHPGFGGLDIYKSIIIKGEFSNPKNMGLPYNSSYDDFGIIMLGKDSGMLCSNRPDGVGDDDIYSFHVKNKAFYLTGVVFDNETRQPLKNALVIVGDQSLRFDSVRTGADGKYFISALNPTREYVLTVYKNGYLGDLKYYRAAPGLIENEKDTAATVNIAMLKITGEEINISNIYYDFGKWNLTPESKNELLKLVKLLRVNPVIKIRINSHTDAIGDEEFNLELSNYRAQSVVNYLVENGIETERLTFKGWGESNPVVKNPQNDGEHRMNRRTSFQIVNVAEIDNEYSPAAYKNLTESIVIGHVKELDAITGSFEADSKKDVVFRLQIYAGKERISRTYINQVENLIGRYKIVSSKGKDGYYRYAVGDFKKFEQAMEMKGVLSESGYESFVVAFMNNLRITILEARQLSEKNNSN